MTKSVDIANEAWRLRSKVLHGQFPRKEREELVKQCLDLLSSAVKEAEQNDDAYSLAYSLNKLAHIRGDLEGRMAAIELYRLAAEAGRRAGSGLLEGEALRHWADHLRHMAKYEEALSMYEQALQALQSDSNTSSNSLGNLYRPMGILYEETGKISLAMEYWQKARELYCQAGIEAGVEECDDHLQTLERRQTDA